MRRTFVLLLTVATVALAACSTRDRQAITVGSPNPSGGETVAAPEDEAGRLLTQAEADAALLTAEDVGPNWAVKPDAERPDVGSGDATSSDPDCQRFIEALDAKDTTWGLGAPSVEAAAEIAKEGGGFLELDQVSAGVESFADTIDTDALDELAGSLEECSRFTVTGDDGVSMTVELFPLTLPNYGDATFAVRFQVSAGIFIAVMDVASVVVGHNLVSIAVFGLGGVDTEMLPRLVETSVRRLDEVTAAA